MTSPTSVDPPGEKGVKGKQNGRTLIWKRYENAYDAIIHTSGEKTAVSGQYKIWSRYRKFRVSNQTGEISEQVLGDANSLDEAKAIAQVHADGRGDDI